MSRIRDLAKILTASTDMATDAEVTSSIASHAAAADPHTVYLKESDFWAAGKNKLINGDFAINQRGFTSTTAQGAFGFDRFSVDIHENTCTYSAQTFTPGSAPVVGYEATNFARFVTAGQNTTSGYSIVWQRIEDARTLAGQTATFSLWARAGSGTPKIAVELVQKFGNGGSAEVQTLAGQITLSTSWTRYSVTVSIPSVSGKTIGSGSCLAVNLWLSAGTAYNSRTNSIGVQNNTIDVWGWQLEAGSVATPFTTATGNPASELAACQRYYYRVIGTTNQGILGQATASNSAQFPFRMPVEMRVGPTLGFNSATNFFVIAPNGGVAGTTSALSLGVSNTKNVRIDATAGGLTAGNATQLQESGGNPYLDLSAEL